MCTNLLEINLDLLNLTRVVCEQDLVIKKNLTTWKHHSNKSSVKSLTDDFNSKTIIDDIMILIYKFESVSATNMEVECQ